MSTRSNEAPAGSSITEDSAGVSPSVASPAVAPSPFSYKRFFFRLSPLLLLAALMVVDVPLCPSNTMLGIPCPGCGLTRATLAALSGDLAGMLRWHPLAPILTPLVVFSVTRVFLISAGVLRSDFVDPFSKLPRWFWIALGIALIGLYVARMAGFLGGLPDPIDPSGGVLYRAIRFVTHDAWVAIGAHAH